MSYRKYFALIAPAVALAGCVQSPALDRSFPVVLGVDVPAGIPCGHVAADRRDSVPGCEAFVADAGPEMSRDQLIDLNTRFREEVQSNVNFDFDSDTLGPDARAVLDRQAEWMNEFPGLRFSVFGHTDLVGSLDYNFDLAKRRADATVDYLLSHGVLQAQLESVVSYGETQPVIETSRREEQNRRTVTEVSGFLRVDGRTLEPVVCDWIATIYLPTYHQCISEDSSVPIVPSPREPDPVPHSVEVGYSGSSSSGSASITRNADGSETRAASGTTGDPTERTSTDARSTSAPDGADGPLSATASGPGGTVSASATPNADGTTTYRAGDIEVTY